MTINANNTAIPQSAQRAPQGPQPPAFFWLTSGSFISASFPDPARFDQAHMPVAKDREYPIAESFWLPRDESRRII
jgi:hypothetical protein